MARLCQCPEPFCGNGVAYNPRVEPVELIAGEDLGIELPHGERITARISSCEGGLLALTTSNGAGVELHRVDAHAAFAAFKLFDGFRRQIWTVH